MVYEFKPKMEWDKGKALKWLLCALGLDCTDRVYTIYIGDDTTDEDVFGLFPDLMGIGIRVTDAHVPTAAKLTLRNPDEVGMFLQKILDYGQEVGAAPVLIPSFRL